MYQKIIILDQNSSIEVTTRVESGIDKVIIALRGSKTERELAVIASSISEEQIDLLISALNEAKNSKRIG